MAGPDPARLVAGVLFGDPTAWEEAASMLTAEFGALAEERLSFAFERTEYYTREMGAGLTRLFCAFEKPVSQDQLPRIRRRTGRIEKRLALSGGGGQRRRVNIDPGLLTLERLVLSSTKDFCHRLYLGGGVFGEVELVCRDGSFRPLEWTYPDYRRPEALEYFNRLRVNWRKRLRSVRRAAAGVETTP